MSVIAAMMTYGPCGLFYIQGLLFNYVFFLGGGGRCNSVFRSHIQNIFLDNNELWTKSLENTVNVFQRKTLRKILKIRWPDKIRNEDLYEKCGVKEWTKIIKEWRLRWYGHLLRQPNNTWAKRALREARREVKKPKGGQKLTWLKLVDRDLEKVKVVVENSVMNN